ncbi:hypothetical protein AFGD_007479 [Aspergillus flavus]|nr:hypothetical protein AFGD_007479 [Aspergillus flavus]
MAWVIKELQWKADIFNKTGYVRVFDVGVIKSDTVISKDLQEALKERVRPLNDVPRDQKDYHPQSDQKVVDLVHPSLFRSFMAHLASYWTALLNVMTHRGQYDSIGNIITQTIPLWEKSLSSRHFEEDRIKYTEVKYGEHLEPEPIPPWDGLNLEDYADTPKPWSEAEEDAYYELLEAWDASRPIILPEPGEFRPHEETEYKRVDLQKEFPGQRIQVIVKLANIKLTPESPDYEGGSCHIEGQLNERIAASAIYYYDSENIKPSTLSFRQHGRSDFWVFGTSKGMNFSKPSSDLGSVLCQEGRLLTFPNTVQRHVSSFSLADRSKPGHRRILALFLVDPQRRIISSANVPPQREDWLPEELESKANRDTKPLMTMDEAREARLELMAERSLQSAEGNRKYETGDFNLCEH